MDYGDECGLSHRERQNALSMAVHHGADFRTCCVDGSVDEALEIGRSTIASDSFAIEGQFHDIRGYHQLGTARARLQEAPGIQRVPDADMAKCVEDPFTRKNTIRND